MVAHIVIQQTPNKKASYRLKRSGEVQISKNRSSRWQIFFKIGLLKNLGNLTEKTTALESVLKKGY